MAERVYAAMHKAHGLKFVLARNEREATAISTQRAGKVPPLWVAVVPDTHYASVRVLVGIGWNITQEGFAKYCKTFRST